MTSASSAGAAGAVRGGKGVPAESTQVGTGRSIEAAKRGGRVGIIGGDGRDSLRNGSFDVENFRNGSFDVDGIEGKGIVKSSIKHIESSVHLSSVGFRILNALIFFGFLF